jgi:hypothetical protein
VISSRIGGTMPTTKNNKVMESSVNAAAKPLSDDTHLFQLNNKSGQP